MAILGFRMAGVTLTDSGVGLFIAVLRPSAPVVIQRIAGEEGRLIRRALGVQTTGCAGLVVDRLFFATMSSDELKKAIKEILLR